MPKQTRTFPKRGERPKRRKINPQTRINASLRDQRSARSGREYCTRLGFLYFFSSVAGATNAQKKTRGNHPDLYPKIKNVTVYCLQTCLVNSLQFHYFSHYLNFNIWSSKLASNKLFNMMLCKHTEGIELLIFKYSL